MQPTCTLLTILHDPLTLRHRTVEFAYGKLQAALESPERIEAILKAIGGSNHKLNIHNLDIAAIPEKLQEILKSTHDEEYLTHLSTAHKTWVAAGAIEPHESVLPECFLFPTRTTTTHSGNSKPPNDMFARAGYYAFDMSTGIMADTFHAALASANLAYHGVQVLLQSEPTPPKNVLSLCRPPGHHCDTNRAGGFCYINNAVVAIAAVHQHSPQAKVGILDIDFHHGNGTQEHFYDSADVLYVSIHGEDEFPYYTGAEEEIGVGDGRGFNVNLPLKTGSSVTAYLERLYVGLRRLEDFKPEFLLVSLGFDTFHLDPLGNFKIDTEDYQTIAHQIRSRLKAMPALILLEGGYVIDKLGENVLSFLAGWDSLTQLQPPTAQ